MTMHDALWVYDRPGLRNISPHRVAVLSREQRQVFRIYSPIRCTFEFGARELPGGLVIGIINIIGTAYLQAT